MGKDIKGTTRVCGLIGNPVHHTLSPAIHNTLNELTDTDMVYVPFEVRGENVEAAVKGALALDVLGLNVTIPHKSAVIPFLKEIDPVAEKIGAVNTLVRTEDNTGFRGYNTDYTGLLRSLKEENVSLSGQSVIILGAGGVARPAAFMCVNEGAAEVYILNRTFERAADLCADVNEYAGKDIAIPMELSAYNELPSDKKYICMQMTQVGLFPESDKAVIEDPSFYEKLSTGFDAVYRPLNTQFLQNCKKAGAKSISGLRMLLYQGIDAYEKWDGIKITRNQSETVYGRLLGELMDGQNIVLTGFMGSGKSTVAKMLSTMLGYELLDSDSEIEHQQRTTISSIFEHQGEGAFRDMETEYIKQLLESEKKRFILSVGGGLPLKEVNREFLKKIGKVIFLKAKPETVYDRIKDDRTRPLLKSDDVLQKIKDLQNERRAVYEDASDIEIDTDAIDALQVANEIIERLI
ncbi:shikimate dehydrogenase [Butyrivibrio sp. INlla16]|uniref:shikimate dehydrogenase n=1 Tax=Butyrivibrio sp. INlla16 TaxID=1520807 RepID=UPI00087E613D|nr:shikimate dehydrogenase [Butyrivibrio sp. INlla16]SDB34620.1 shikimate dehydrogenase [Butyrivibrio sp. INlla16]